MDSIFGIGPLELVVILLLAGIVMGPHRIRHVARWLGRVTAQLQAISRTFARQLNAELDAIDQSGEIKGAMQDVKDLQRQIAELRREITSITNESVHEGRQAIQESQQLLQETVARPAVNARTDGQRLLEQPNGDSTQAPRLPNLLEVPDDPDV